VQAGQGRQGRRLYDLGCGDGRMVITAVKKFGAKRGVGVDIDEDLVKKSQRPPRRPASPTRSPPQGRLLKVDACPTLTVVLLYMGDDITPPQADPAKDAQAGQAGWSRTLPDGRRLAAGPLAGGHQHRGRIPRLHQHDPPVGDQGKKSKRAAGLVPAVCGGGINPAARICRECIACADVPWLVLVALALVLLTGCKGMRPITLKVQLPRRTPRST